ncbi:hypothetical protein [Nocardioides montaniterrae]
MSRSDRLGLGDGLGEGCGVGCCVEPPEGLLAGELPAEAGCGAAGCCTG